MNNKVFFASVVAVAFLVSCGGKENKDDVNQDSVALYQTREELQQTVAMQDSLFALINEIGADMAQIRQVESIVSLPSNIGTESGSKREQLKNDIALIGQALKQRRERLASLEKKLRDSNSHNSTMISTIETLKAQIADQEHEIESLRGQLADANAQITSLNEAVDSLNVTVNDERSGKERALEEAAQLTNELNTCYYAIGSKKELQSHNIIKSSFLRKTKILQGDFERNYFTAVDKRNFKSLALHSKKAKILSNQPTDSYEISENASGQKTLVITNPSKFWGTTNYLIIQID